MHIRIVVSPLHKAGRRRPSITVKTTELQAPPSMEDMRELLAAEQTFNRLLPGVRVHLHMEEA